MKTLALFSGGKDSFFSLEKAVDSLGVDLLVSITSAGGATQLHAGPEGSKEVRRAQIDAIGLPNKEIEISSGPMYLHELFTNLQKIIRKERFTHLVTGDLWHPYTSGIGDMLASALGVTIVRPARDVCPDRNSDVKYMKEIVRSGINSVIVSVRTTSLPKEYVGKEINEDLIKKLAALGIDAAAEGGEYQSLVTSAHSMKNKIVIQDYSVETVPGKDGRESFYRMKIKKFKTVPNE